MSTTEASSFHSDDLESINSVESTEIIESTLSIESIESVSSTESTGLSETSESSMSVVSLGDDESDESIQIQEHPNSPINITTEANGSNYTNVPTSEDCFSASYDDYIPAPPPSWTSSVEAFVKQCNHFDDIYNSDSSESFEMCEFKGLGELSDSEYEEEENAVMGAHKFLTYLAVPVLISQILMIILITNASNSNVNGKDIAVPLIRPVVCTIHHHHYHHNNHYFYFEKKNPDGNFSKQFLHIFFNPFSVISNSKFYKMTTDWFTEQANDPTSIIGQFFKYLDSYLRAVQLQFNKLNDVVRSGLDTEIEKTLRIRDKWTKKVYEKVYKIAETPQYKRAVSTVSKWASAVKDRLFSSSH